MCGIAGFVLTKGNPEEHELKSMCDALAQRGPDDEGIFIHDSVALGHRRLSIIDLNTGHQPMFSDDKKIVLIFNGEIYNFLSLKSELQLLGVNFNTTSDTEVIIKGYERFGIDGILQRLEGMFAFALYDLSKREVYVARDRFGEKPLFYYHDERGFFFASELKALTRNLANKKIDVEALNLFVTLTYIPAPRTIFENVKKLLPASLVTIDGNGKVRTRSYYSLKEVVESQVTYKDYNKAKKDLRDDLFKSVSDRMISDVPIGAFLSGGVDSSIVSAIMAKHSTSPIHTFSIGFKEKSYDESKRAALVAKHINADHHVHIVEPDQLLDVVDSVLRYFDEPFGDSTAIPLFILSKIAREKVSVVLTGDCADELFAGYEKYLGPYYAERYRKVPKSIRSVFEGVIALIPHTQVTNHFLRKVKKVIDGVSLPAFELHYALMSLGLKDHERKALLAPSYFRDIKPTIAKEFAELHHSSDIEKGFFTDIKIVLEGDMLPKTDRMCMFHSLEARLPYLDSKIVGNSFRMPLDYKLNGSNKKRILKETFADLLPEKVFRFSKKGFGVPIAVWFRNELRTELESSLSENAIKSQGIFNPSEIRKLMDEHMSGKENHAPKLWCLFVFQKWYQQQELQ